MKNEKQESPAAEILWLRGLRAFVAENSAGIAVIQNYPGLFWREAEPDELFQGCRVGIESEKRVAPGFPAFAGLGRFAG